MKAQHQIYLAVGVIVAVLLKSLFIQGWTGTVEIAAALGLLAWRWTFEPKVVPLASKQDLEEVQKAIENLGAQAAKTDGKVLEMDREVSALGLTIGAFRKTRRSVLG